jgi:hypothetical protein
LMGAMTSSDSGTRIIAGALLEAKG